MIGWLFHHTVPPLRTLRYVITELKTNCMYLCVSYSVPSGISSMLVYLTCLIRKLSSKNITACLPDVSSFCQVKNKFTVVSCISAVQSKHLTVDIVP